jgi:hypothetical protein
MRLSEMPAQAQSKGIVVRASCSSVEGSIVEQVGGWQQRTCEDDRAGHDHSDILGDGEKDDRAVDDHSDISGDEEKGLKLLR